MSESNLKVFVLKKNLTSTGLYPTSQEIYDLMHLVKCEHAIDRWQEEWSFCPVCLAGYEASGAIIHHRREH